MQNWQGILASTSEDSKGDVGTMLTAAVIGIGEMGRHHARVYAQMPDVRLVAVADSDAGKLAQVTRTWGAKTYTNYVEMLAEEKPNLASVCVPTSAHFRVTQVAMQAGCHVLVEKPIAATLKEAWLLLKFAEISKRILAVGHIERCNPIVTAVKRHIDGGDLGRIYRISTRRVGPSPVRIRDVGVTVDLATHDLDIMRYLLQSEPVAYQAELQWNKHGAELSDGVAALIRFESGAVGVLEADWLSSAKERTLVVTGAEGVITADYLSQTAVIEFEPGERVAIGVSYVEPLRAELEAFANAVRGEGKPAATGEDGAAALRMALQILKAGAKGERN